MASRHLLIGIVEIWSEAGLGKVTFQVFVLEIDRISDLNTLIFEEENVGVEHYLRYVLVVDLFLKGRFQCMIG